MKKDEEEVDACETSECDRESIERGDYFKNIFDTHFSLKCFFVFEEKYRKSVYT